MFELMNNLSNAMVCEDTQAMFDFIANEPEASDGPIGVTGYCMSGPFVFAAAAFLERIKAAASIHGVRLCIDANFTALTADKIQGEMYFGCAETDEWAPPEMVEKLDAHLASTGINYRTSGTRKPNTALFFRNVARSFTRRPRSGTGNACSPC